MYHPLSLSLLTKTRTSGKAKRRMLKSGGNICTMSVRINTREYESYPETRGWGMGGGQDAWPRLMNIFLELLVYLSNGPL